jgi:hypothetical protein
MGRVLVVALVLTPEFYVYVESHDRAARERSMRRRGLKRLWTSLHELRNRKSTTRDDLLMHRGALKKEAGRDFGLVRVSIPNPQEPVNGHTFHFNLDRERLRRTLRREGCYLLRSNMQMIDVHLPTTDGRHIVMSRYT